MESRDVRKMTSLPVSQEKVKAPSRMMQGRMLGGDAVEGVSKAGEQLQEGR